MHCRHPLSSVAYALVVASAAIWAAIPSAHADPLVPEDLARYWNESLSGGPPKDGIPSIDAPQWRSADEADAVLADDDRVIGVYHRGEARAYPQGILVWHEIVNDTIGGDHVSVTYCPLTGTAIGFLRDDNELGVSGRLVNSNLIMYDRNTDSHWPQILGVAVEGPASGEALEEFRVFWTTWKRWRDRHPKTRVLSESTGYARNYAHDPYGSYTPVSGYYAADAGRLFPVMHEDERYAPKREIFGFRDAGQAVAVDKDHLRRQRVLRHRHGEHQYVIIHDPGLDTAWVYRGDADDTSIPAHDALAFHAEGPRHDTLEGLTPVNGFEAMWFAWSAFYPDTAVINGD